MKEGDWECPGCGNHNFASRVNCNKCRELRQGFKEGDWICKSCKNHNFASKTFCNKKDCALPRPHDAGGGRQMQFSPAARAYGGGGGCGGCGGMGGMGSYGPYGGKGGMMYSGGKGGMMHGGGNFGMMYGGGCAYGGGYGGPCMGGMGGPVYGGYGGKGMMMMQAPVVPYRGMMGGSMKGGGGSSMKDGDWMCHSCGNHNFASRVNCNSCKIVRPGFKEGDWICKDKECKNHNFKSRTECNKCHKPKA